MMTRLDRANWDEINAMYADLETSARSELNQAGVPHDAITVTRWAEMRLEGQYHEIAVDLPNGVLGDHSLAGVSRSFSDAYARQYGRVLEGLPIEALHWRLSASGPETQAHLQPGPLGDDDASAAIKGNRPAWFDSSYIDTTVYDRDSLRPGMTLTGPAIIEEREATAVIWPGDLARVDPWGAIVVEINAQSGGAA
jgi:5-oxoprolinase (ATP-hydrolysing)/N-methylhydantoinase A